MITESTDSKIVIAIDGTAASGKGTLARRLADHLGYAYLDTGKLYRYVGNMIITSGFDPNDESKAISIAKDLAQKLSPSELDDPKLLSDEAGQAASKVGQYKEVRSALLKYQKSFAKSPPEGAKGAILDGRDIGTVICPDAHLKLYVDASIQTRAKRRFKELQSKGISVTYDAVLADMQERDERDSQRNEAPMKPASDAIMLDTSNMSIEDVLQQVLALVADRLQV